MTTLVNKWAVFLLAALLGMGSAGAAPPWQAAGKITGVNAQQHEKSYKPQRLTGRRLKVPSKDVVREIGGIRYGRHVDVKLEDGTTVRCFPAATKDPTKVSKNWYYLPVNPRVAKDSDGTPKFSMVRFVTDKTKEQGGVDGAILHFLVEYGLTPKQKKEAEKLLKKQQKGAKLKGAVPLEVGAEGNSFHVISATLGDKGFTSTLVSSGKAPVMEGSRAAVAARLDQYGATLLAKSLENPTTDISVVFDLKYVVKLPAYDVRVIIDYERYHELMDSSTESRRKRTKTKRYWDPKWYNPSKMSTRKVTTLTEDEQQQVIDNLTEVGVVKFDYVQHVPDADKEIVESGLHKLVLESFFDMQNRLGTPSGDEVAGEEEQPEDKERVAERRKQAAKVRNYRYTVFQRKEITRRSQQVLSLKKTIARYEQHQMVGNVGHWYKDYKDDPKLVTEVNLDDPFFQRREMRFVIDNEAYDIFKQMVNYATVQVRVPRKGARSFEEEVTIDKKFLEQNGQTAMLTFARMADDAQTYEYATQWSLRGGQLYPRKPKWQKGDLMTTTLAAPVTPLTLEAEADLGELEELGFARVSVELKYRRFGKEYRDQKGLALSPAGGEAVVNKVIYHDAGQDKVQYRLIYHHKKLGKMKDDAWKNVEGAYIYCAPSELVLDKVRDLL